MRKLVAAILVIFLIFAAAHLTIGRKYIHDIKKLLEAGKRMRRILEPHKNNTTIRIFNQLS